MSRIIVSRLQAALLLGLSALTVAVSALGESTPPARPTMDAFFSGQHLKDAAISPDGRYVALIIESNSSEYVAVTDRINKTPAKLAMVPDPKDHATIQWCKWVNETRVMCSLMGVNNNAVFNMPGWAIDQTRRYHPITRLVAFDADGSNQKMFLKNGQSWNTIRDRIFDWTPNDPKTVLINLPDDGSIKAYAMDVYTGSLKVLERGMTHVAGYFSDGQGNIRMAAGHDIEDNLVRIYARLTGSNDWTLAMKFKYSPLGDYFWPISVISGTNDMYATKSYNGFQALWKVDLLGRREPELLFDAPNVEVEPLFGEGHRFLGVTYTSDRIHVHYIDEDAVVMSEVVEKALPGRINTVLDYTKDMKAAIVSSETDTSAPSFYVVDIHSNPARREKLGEQYSGLKTYTLSPMQSVSLVAEDGAKIPGYLTLPIGAAGKNLPFVVLPHGGPYARDNWGFDSWVQFLASRGYGVLQVEFRGSAGFGEEWMRASFGDWGGKAYSDVDDGTRWLIDQSYADPKRICIVGASFGGFMALQGAVKDSDRYRCAISIAGVSDLADLISDDERYTGYNSALREQIGNSKDKLREYSPRLHAKSVSTPVLLIHGNQDYTVEPDQSKLMDDALTAAGKPHEVLSIKGADHYFRQDEYRQQLFGALDAFLGKYLGPGAPLDAP